VDNEKWLMTLAGKKGILACKISNISNLLINSGIFAKIDEFDQCCTILGHLGTTPRFLNLLICQMI